MKVIPLSLKRKNIAITGSEMHAHELAQIVSGLGGKPYIAPMWKLSLKKTIK
ncbi:MAG: hypothetical protein AOA65_1049 [Candidatus Bathyarchaeota archaeon BA1]|nr:MAG: hypothetical protein AOA65_1049 [Candidatus Bathyarchaeota archaeon BA1]